MHGEPSIRDDSALLASWAQEGNEDAFAQIVRQYERLVLGAAWRRTGDAELARDVAQQVFATLGAKARTLLGRRNVAGWLYQAASHIGARAAQAETRRLVAHERAASAAPSLADAPETPWPHVEDALARLRDGEREALVLHYFQDLTYPEMAGALRIEEAAARKRVSRALQSLETQLRRRGLRGSVAALLTAAAAQQAALPASAGLATAALATVPAVAPLSTAVATFMSHSTLKIACAAALIATPLVLEWKANASLKAEIAQVRSAHPQLAAPRTDTDPLPRAKAELAAKRTARLAAEQRVIELRDLKTKAATEVVISFGSVDTMATKLARTVSLMRSLDKTKDSKLEPGSEAFRDRMGQAELAAEGLPDFIALLPQISRLERSPEKAARFYATLYGEVAGLNEAARTLMEEHTRDWLREMQGAGLALPQRPKANTKDWDKRRDAATRQLFTTLSSQLPARPPGQPAFEEVFALGGNDADGPTLYEMMSGGEQP